MQAQHYCQFSVCFIDIQTSSCYTVNLSQGVTFVFSAEVRTKMKSRKAPKTRPRSKRKTKRNDKMWKNWKPQSPFLQLRLRSRRVMLDNRESRENLNPLTLKSEQLSVRQNLPPQPSSGAQSFGTEGRCTRTLHCLRVGRGG